MHILSVQVRHLRRKHASGKLEQWQVDRLNLLGFEWEMGDVQVRTIALGVVPCCVWLGAWPSVACCCRILSCLLKFPFNGWDRLQLFTHVHKRSGM